MKFFFNGSFLFLLTVVTAKSLSAFSCHDLPKEVQKKIESHKDYQAADSIETCLEVLPQSSPLYAFLAKHYHRRKQYQRSAEYYRIYFRFHQGTFTEKMIVVHNYFALQNFSAIKDFLQKYFPQPPTDFQCVGFYEREISNQTRAEEYLCHLKKFQEHGITSVSFENFLNSHAVQSMSNEDVVFWYEVRAGLFPNKSSYQALALFLYQSRRLQKSLEVFRFLQKNYCKQNDNPNDSQKEGLPAIMIQQILHEQGKEQ